MGLLRGEVKVWWLSLEVIVVTLAIETLDCGTSELLGSCKVVRVKDWPGVKVELSG